jgi:hypothetical protein
MLKNINKNIENTIEKYSIFEIKKINFKNLKI